MQKGVKQSIVISVNMYVITDIQDGIYDLKVGFSMILPPILLCV